MTDLMAIELVIAIWGMVSYFSLYSKNVSDNGARLIRFCTVLTIVWLLVHALSCAIDGRIHSTFIVLAVNCIAYLFGGIVYIFLLKYLQVYIGRRTTLNRYAIVIPIGVMLASLIVIVWSFIVGDMLVIDGGYVSYTDKLPVSILYLHMALQLYIVGLTFFKSKKIGIKAAMLFSLYGISLTAAVIIKAISGMDFSIIMNAISMYVIVALLQRKVTQSEIAGINAELIKSNSRLVKVNDDLAKQLKQNEELKQQVKRSQETAIRRIIDIILGAERDQEVIDRLVNYIGEYFGADRAYVFERNADGKSVGNTHEWVRIGVTAEKDNLQGISLETISPWIEAFEDKGCFFISCDGEYAKKEPLVFEILKPQNISSLMAASMVRNGEFYGFIGVDNPTKCLDHELLMLVAASAINHRTYIAEDRRREKEHLELLEKARNEAETANNAKTVFLNNMSHDIRTPMNAILGYAKLIRKDVDDKEKVEDYLAKMEMSGDYLLSIINNILEVSRIDSGKESLDLAFADLADRKYSVFPVLEAEMNRKHLEFVHTFNIKHRYVMADMTKLGEIVMNILSNSIKYTMDGGRISLDFSEIPCDRDGYARYVATITDTGMGMSKEFLEQIFDSFSRERNTTDSKIAGTGLGMSIVKRLVDLMGGTIVVNSELGKGSSFVTTLDFSVVDNPEKYLDGPGKHLDGGYDLSGKRILLAEDNELNAEIAMELLGDMGAVVDWAEDGLICVDMLENAATGYYDFILMDIQMPNLNGYDATVRIRELADREKAEIPIIAMTANAFEEDKKMAIEKGMNSHVAKPIDIPGLVKLLGDILG